MKKIIFIAVLSIIGQGIVHAQTTQRRCGFDVLKKMLEEKNVYEQYYNQKIEKVQNDIAAYNAETNSKRKPTGTTGSVVTIPVVFHIVLNSAQLSQLSAGGATIAARVSSQIDILNNDFAGLNADSTSIPSAFKPLFGKSDIRFGLAHRAPNGHSTSGYEVITTIKAAFDAEQGTQGSGYGFSDAKYAAANGAEAWDVSKYLNIWVINMTDNGAATSILGLTISTSTASAFFMPSSEIGISLNYGAFGKRTGLSQYFISGIDKGRTLTHEMGHFFELAHTWGDDNGKCPGQPGGHDDGISDTPPEADHIFGTPAFPKYDVCSASGNGVMFMNYMDYVDDGSMQMFSKEQATLMNAQVISSGESYSLTTHPEILQWPTDVASVSSNADLNISPNPASNNVTISSGYEKINTVYIVNMMGQQVKTISLQNQNIYNINVSDLSKGIYFIQCLLDNQTVVSRKILLQ